MEQKWTNKLNNAEFSLICDTYYPELKKSATEKIKSQLFELGGELQQILPGFGFKISAGENHHHLPYIVLDYPKIGGNEFPFLFRTVFWWGKPVSYQVILRNSFLGSTDSVKQWIEAKTSSRNEVDNIYLWLGENLWDNDLQGKSYKVLQEINDMELALILERTYMKIACSQPMKKPENLFEEAIGFYNQFIAIISTAQQGS